MVLGLPRTDLQDDSRTVHRKCGICRCKGAAANFQSRLREKKRFTCRKTDQKVRPTFTPSRSRVHKCALDADGRPENRRSATLATPQKSNRMLTPLAMLLYIGPLSYSLGLDND